MGSVTPEFPRWLWNMLITLCGAAGGIFGFSAILSSDFNAEGPITLFDMGIAVALTMILAVSIIYIVGIIVFTKRTAVKF